MTRAAACLVSLCAMLSTAPAVLADPDQGCELRIGAIVASNSGNMFDDRLAPLKRQFVALFPYSSYRLIKAESRNVHWGSRAGFELPGGRYLMVIPREYKDGRVTLKILLIEGSRQIVDTALALKNRGTFLVGGPRHEGGVLIIAIGAHSAM